MLLILCVRPSPPAALYMLDVGQGDGLFVEAGRGRNKVRILVDGGSSDRVSVGEYTLKPFLMYHGAGYVDLAILTHDDYDHHDFNERKRAAANLALAGAVFHLII